MIKKLFIIQIIVILGFLLFMFKEELGLVKSMHDMDYIDRVSVYGLDYPTSDGLCISSDGMTTFNCETGVSEAFPISIIEPQYKATWTGGGMYQILWRADSKNL